MYVDYKACLNSFARDPVKCRLPPPYGSVIHVELVRFISGQPENIAVVPPSRAPQSRPQGHIPGLPPPPPVLPLAPPGVGTKGVPTPTIPGPNIYPQPKNSPIGPPPPGPVPYGNGSQYPAYMVPEDGPSSNGVPPHKKRKLPEPDENVAPPPHKRPIRSRTPTGSLPGIQPHAVEPPNHYDHFLGASHIVPRQSPPVYSPRGHRARSPPHSPNHNHLNGGYAHNPPASMTPPGPPIHSFHSPHSSGSLPPPYSNGHSRSSGPPPRQPHSPRGRLSASSVLPAPVGNEVAPPSAPPQGIRKVKLVVKPQDKPAFDPAMPSE